MIRSVRSRVLVLAAFAVLLVGAGYLIFWTPSLDDEAEIEAALPSEADMPGYVENWGILAGLSSPLDEAVESDEELRGKYVLTGGYLDGQCQVYEDEGDGWVCDDLRGIGMVGYADEGNVYSRVGTTLFAYDDRGSAMSAWEATISKVRDEFPEADERAEPEAGDESLTFMMAQEISNITVLRVGSVVAQAVAYNEYGPAVGEEFEQEMKGLIEMWAPLQAETIEAEL